MFARVLNRLTLTLLFFTALLSFAPTILDSAASTQAAPPGTDNPRWKILALIYAQTDFTYTDGTGQHHVVASMTQAEEDRASTAATRFAQTDVPALDSGYMLPEIQVRFPTRALTTLSGPGACRYAPNQVDVAPELDPAFDSVFVIWDDTGTDENGQPADLYTCEADTVLTGTSQTYVRIPVDSIAADNEDVFKHEWGHAITFFYDASGTAPRPRVELDISPSNPYVHCPSGSEYGPPSTFGNNDAGFYHDIYSGTTALRAQPTRCLGVLPDAWASGGPVQFATGNLIVNGGFEADGNNDGKPGSWTPDSHVSRSNSVVHGGSFSMQHLASTHDSYTVSQAITGRRIVPGRNYQFSGWTNIPQITGSSTFAIEFRWRDAAGTTIQTNTIKTYRGVTSGWDGVTATLLAPSGTEIGEVRMVVTNLKGTVYVDDFILQEGAFQGGDSDADGFINGYEVYMGTDPNRERPMTTTADDELVDSWPTDFNDDTFTDITDLSRIQSTPPFGTMRGEPGFTTRYDLNADEFVDISDVSFVENNFGKSCRQGRCG